MFDNMFHEITAILLAAAGLGIIGLVLRQPLIVSLLAAGILIGPSGFGLIRSHDQIELLAHIGIALLLFVVGLKLDLHLIRTTGKVALATGLGQVLFTSVFGFVIALGLGLAVVEAVYVAVALTFSSTIIIVKLLSDKREIDSLHGRIAIGFLIIQDIVVVLVMIGLTALGGRSGGQENVVLHVLWVLGAGVAFLAGIALMTRYVLPALLKYLARSQELLVLFAVVWAISLATLGDALGFSKEVGAFLGGVSLASTPYREALSTRLVSLRDFLLIFFFIDLGARLNLALLGAQVGNAAVFSLFVLIGNPLIVLVIMGYLGYRKRTGFLAGLTVAQISEFSLILGALGLSLGHITMETMGLITLVGLLTIGISTYLILYSGPLYQLLSPWLQPFERKVPYQETTLDSTDTVPATDIILIGLGNYGGGIALRLLQRKRQLVGVDFDPAVLDAWQKQGLPVFYGDVGDPELLEHLPLGRARLVVSTVRDRNLNLNLKKNLQAQGYAGKLVLTARHEEEARDFLTAGADIVLRPFFDAAEQAADYLAAALYVFTESVDWPVGLRIFRLEADSLFAGSLIGAIPLRRETGVSIIAVTRGKKTFFDPDSHMPLYPGDRLVLSGEPEKLAQAEAFLALSRLAEEEAVEERFSIAEIPLAFESPLVGRSLADTRFRETFGVTVIGIRRDGRRLAAPTGKEILQAGDGLIVAGKSEVIKSLQSKAPI
ncbi:MAG: sodium:proton exchanger [Deltaproteobacteria bacterium]|nr:sodium:proton exchanger [Deltaproteobacteria bacterium]